MLTFLIHSRTAWNDYFTGTFSPNLNSQTYTSRQTPSGTNVYISNCLFRSITSSSDGGALYCTSVTNFLVESTFFFSCKTSGYRGAIYFYNTGGQSVLYEVCGYDCYSTHSSPYYQFAYIRVRDAATYKNNVNYSSITRCVTESSNSYYPLYLQYGIICCLSVNVSLNRCYYRSGIFCYAYCNTNYVTCSLTYSSFIDNIATGYTCIMLDSGCVSFEMKSCNILRNTQGTLGTEGIIFANGNLMIENSCIFENKANRIFFQYSSSKTITISNCTVDSTSSNGRLTIQNTVTKGFILALNHMSTENCHSEYDSAGNLTPNIQTPSSSKKPIHCCTCGCQLTFSTTFIFLFMFIHPGSSNCL
jgi:hypothetical protein